MLKDYYFLIEDSEIKGINLVRYHFTYSQGLINNIFLELSRRRGLDDSYVWWKYNKERRGVFPIAGEDIPETKIGIQVTSSA